MGSTLRRVIEKAIELNIHDRRQVATPLFIAKSAQIERKYPCDL